MTALTTRCDDSTEMQDLIDETAHKFTSVGDVDDGQIFHQSPTIVFD
jgi:hypothetical protein